ncbi:MAG: GAF domain-containing protein [Actinomycetota bacterium]|nr:GAF domain-containing protein [Actinomycetota bacterium]
MVGRRTRRRPVSPSGNPLVSETLLRQGHDDEGVDGGVLTACREAMRVAEADGAGVSLVSANGQHLTLCSTDGVSRAVEDLQLTLGEGPCVDAVRFGIPVLRDDLSSAVNQMRWPGFAPEAVAAGVRALYAFPLRLAGVTLGTMDLYRSYPGPLSARARRETLAAPSDVTYTVLTDRGVAALVTDPFSAEDDPSGSDPASGAYHHFQVHQATGMVTIQAGVDLDRALLLLRARAFSSRRPLLDVARDVLEGRVRITQED